MEEPKLHEIIRKDSFASLFMVFATGISLTLISKNLWTVFWAVLVASITQIFGDAFSDAFAKNTFDNDSFLHTLEIESLPDLFVPVAILVYLLAAHIKSTDVISRVFDRRKVLLYVVVTLTTIAAQFGFTVYLVHLAESENERQKEWGFGGLRLLCILGVGLVIALVTYALELLREHLDHKDHRAINKKG